MKYLKYKIEKIEFDTYLASPEKRCHSFVFFSFQDITKASVNCISAATKTLFHATVIHESPITCIYWVKALLIMVENKMLLEKTKDSGGCFWLM